MDFTRNDFSFWAIIFPILFIFFLLGIICFLEPKDHYLVARIAITLGVFAFVFTFDTILPAVKPDYIKNISTFADFLLKLVLVAAIASTISSHIAAECKKQKYSGQQITHGLFFQATKKQATAFVVDQ
jgi:hypothetical protein